MNLRLLSIPVSPYCEKARWALDLCKLPYVEERHLQVFHYLRSYQVSRGPNVPVLIDAGTVITDSTAILHHLDRYLPPESRLYPQQERAAVEEWEDLFDEVLGVESRRWVYSHALRDPRMAFRISAQGVPLWQKALAPLCYPLIRTVVSRKLEVSAANVRRGMVRARDVIARVDDQLRDGRRYLVGDSFTAADLTFACMMSPFVIPAEYGIRLPDLGEISADMRAVVDEVRATRAGRHALHLFRTHRKPAERLAGTVGASGNAGTATPGFPR